MNWLLPELKNSIEALLGSEYPVTTEIPVDKSAWLAIPVFAAARKLDLSIPDCAEKIAEKLASIPDIEIEVEGGFLNIRPNQIGLERVLNEARLSNYGQMNVGEGSVVMVEFSAPNIAKPMGVGHLRSTIIGDSLQRIYRLLGYEVIAINHLGDWGTQFGNLLAAYKNKFGDLIIRPELKISDLLEMYVGFHTDLQKDVNLKLQGQEAFKLLESGDEQSRELWQFFIQLSLIEFKKTYERLGIHFDDLEAGESRYLSYTSSLLDKAIADNVAVMSEGALIVPIPGDDAPLMLRKTDGSTTYAVRDLAAIEYRIEHNHPNQILYVVANEQALHLRQVFAAARQLKLLPNETLLTHVKFGLVRTPQGRMSTRKGTLISLDDLLNEAVLRANAVISERNQDLSEEERNRIAQTIGIGAIKYFDLSHDRRHDIIFDWERALSLKGDSAPYLEYSYVRAMNIVKKASELEIAGLGDKSEFDLHNRFIRTLARYPLIVVQAGEQAAPHIIAQYLNGLATQFHSFYEQFPVLNASDDERASRVALIMAFKQVLKSGLDLLGIDVVERM